MIIEAMRYSNILITMAMNWGYTGVSLPHFQTHLPCFALQETYLQNHMENPRKWSFFFVLPSGYD